MREGTIIIPRTLSVAKRDCATAPWQLKIHRPAPSQHWLDQANCLSLRYPRLAQARISESTRGIGSCGTRRNAGARGFRYSECWVESFLSCDNPYTHIHGYSLPRDKKSFVVDISLLSIPLRKAITKSVFNEKATKKHFVTDARRYSQELRCLSFLFHKVPLHRLQHGKKKTKKNKIWPVALLAAVVYLIWKLLYEL